MRNELAPRTTTPAELRVPPRATPAVTPRAGGRGKAPPRRGPAQRRIASLEARAQRGAERLEASRCDAAVRRRGLAPDRGARAATLVARGGGHE
ncbi:hypothetical protein [Sorangium sp. So ce1024]|uniref:hypothetical protein n=1 Tax=unclassified Sorangium TaxID=2621164 RepID=UPI003F05D07A